jgi:hypothetical protein
MSVPHMYCRCLARAGRGRLLVRIHLQPVRGTRNLSTSSNTACGALKWLRDVMMPADLVKRVLEACWWRAEGEPGRRTSGDALPTSTMLLAFETPQKWPTVKSIWTFET